MDLEIFPEGKRAELFRLSERHSLFKWLIGTVGLTLVTTIGGWHFQNREVRLEEVRFDHEREIRELEFEQKYLGEFLQFALVEDLDSRVRFAHYFASVSTNEILAAKWKDYHADLVATAPVNADTASPTDAAAARIGGVEALAGRKIAQIWLGAEPVAPMEEFRRYHVEQLGWADVGFHYYVGIDGSINVGRPMEAAPDFVQGLNREAIAVAIACDGWYGAGTARPQGHSCVIAPDQHRAIYNLVRTLLFEHGLEPEAVGKRSDFRPFPDLLGEYVSNIHRILKVPRSRLAPQSSGKTDDE